MQFGCWWIHERLQEDTLDYHEWRNAVFNQPIRDLEDTDYDGDAFNLSLDEAFDHIDRAYGFIFRQFDKLQKSIQTLNSKEWYREVSGTAYHRAGYW